MVEFNIDSVVLPLDSVSDVMFSISVFTVSVSVSDVEVIVRNESFSDCIDRSVYQKLGCVSPWETNSTISSLPTCSTFSDFERMMTEYTTVRKLLRCRQ